MNSDNTQPAANEKRLDDLSGRHLAYALEAELSQPPSLLRACQGLIATCQDLTNRYVEPHIKNVTKGYAIKNAYRAIDADAQQAATFLVLARMTFDEVPIALVATHEQAFDRADTLTVEEALEECERSGYQGNQDLAAVAIYRMDNGKPTQVGLVDRFCSCDSKPSSPEASA